jgi:mannose-6-phosphate isomerase-like protein (cupin superfamily)
MNDEKGYKVADFETISLVACPCGSTKRAFLDDHDKTASFHIVEISKHSRKHYHKKMTEIYYVLEGEGILELDDDEITVKEGTCIMIKPGCKHRAVGKLKLINVPIPAFDENDEWID